MKPQISPRALHFMCLKDRVTLNILNGSKRIKCGTYLSFPQGLAAIASVWVCTPSVCQRLFIKGLQSQNRFTSRQTTNPAKDSRDTLKQGQNVAACHESKRLCQKHFNPYLAGRTTGTFRFDRPAPLASYPNYMQSHCFASAAPQPPQFRRLTRFPRQVYPPTKQKNAATIATDEQLAFEIR